MWIHVLFFHNGVDTLLLFYHWQLLRYCPHIFFWDLLAFLFSRTSYGEGSMSSNMTITYLYTNYNATLQSQGQLKSCLVLPNIHRIENVRSTFGKRDSARENNSCCICCHQYMGGGYLGIQLNPGQRKQCTSQLQC